jgi:hypothetical protein
MIKTICRPLFARIYWRYCTFAVNHRSYAVACFEPDFRLRQHGLSFMFSIFALGSAKMENEENRKELLCRRLKTLTA